MTDPAEAPAAPRSLFVQLLDWMLVPLVIVWPLAILFTYVAARTIADSPFDRELTGTVTALERLVPAEPPAPYEIVPILPASVSEILRTDETDEVRIQVAHADGGLLLGDADVPPLELTELLETPAPRLKDGEIAGERVRIAFRVFRPAGWDRPVAVQVAETLRKRDRLAAEITRTLVGVLLTLLVILVALVLYGLKRGLEPLGALRERVLARDDEDLRPIPFADVPVEVEPLVATVNRQLERVATSVEGQRRFVADAAHQMKTPLAGMKMQAELAARAAGGDELKVRLGQIRAGADRADHLVQRLLALARADEAAVAAKPAEIVDLVAAASGACAALASQASDKSIDFGFEHEGGEAILSGDAVLVGELVSNLAENAIKYTPAGGRVTVRVRGGAAPVLEVEDTGPGIAPAERARVFERFYRVPGSGAAGAGLGLPLVKAVAARHGARVEIGEGEGGGCRFTVSGWRQAPGR